VAKNFKKTESSWVFAALVLTRDMSVTSSEQGNYTQGSGRSRYDPPDAPLITRRYSFALSIVPPGSPSSPPFK